MTNFSCDWKKSLNGIKKFENNKHSTTCGEFECLCNLNSKYYDLLLKYLFDGNRHKECKEYIYN